MAHHDPERDGEHDLTRRPGTDATHDPARDDTVRAEQTTPGQGSTADPLAGEYREAGRQDRDHDGRPDALDYDDRSSDRDHDGRPDATEGDERTARHGAVAPAAAGAAGATAASRHDRDGDGRPDALERTERGDRTEHLDRDRGADRDRTAAAPVAAAAPGLHREAVARQHEAFGGFKWGAAFFGWLAANGFAVVLIALAAAAGAGLSLTTGTTADEATNGNEDTVGLVGGIVLLVVLFLAYFAGGYVAARMSRFDGGRQGVAVWLVGLFITVVLALAGVLFGSKYNVLSDFDLPRLPVDEGDATTGGVVALVLLLLVTLLGAVLGGKTGDRYHRKIDRAGFGAGSDRDREDRVDLDADRSRRTDEQVAGRR